MSVRLLRTLLHGSDVRRAVEREAEVTARASATPGWSSPWAVAAGEPVVLLGTAADGRALVMPLRILAQMALSFGPTGGGKTGLEAHLAVEAITGGVAAAIVWGNSKPDVVAYTRGGLAHRLMRMPAADARRVLDRIVVLAPASEGHLVPLQILSLLSGADPELVAFDAASSFSNLTDAAIGVRQEEEVHDLSALEVDLGLPITVSVRLLRSPELVARLAQRSSNPERFGAFAVRLRRGAGTDRVGGLCARYTRIARLRSMRLMLGGARSCVDFASLLAAGKIVFVDLSAPSHGCEEAIRFVGHFLWKRLVRAALSRSIGSAPAPVFVDEFQELLGAGPDVGTDLERCLRLSRARGVFFHLATQTLAGLERFSSSLPEVLRVNATLRFAFRGADVWDSALPVTLRRRRPLPPPFEPRHGSFFLSRAEELSALRAELETLPDRHCYVHDAKTGRPAVLIRTADAELEMPQDCPDEIVAGLRQGTLSVSVAELERGVEEVERRLRDLAGAGVVPAAEEPTAAMRVPDIMTVPTPPVRRGRRPVELG